MNPKFGKLTPIGPTPKTRGSNELVQVKCDCGKESLIKWSKMTSGHTKSCGKCNLLSSISLHTMKFGRLRVKEPEDINKGSDKIICFICDCGEERFSSARSVFSGRVTTCVKCTKLGFNTKKPVKERKPFKSKLSLVKLISNVESVWKCECGNEVVRKNSRVYSGHVKTCGRCNRIDPSILYSKKYGKLTILNPKEVYPNSTEKLEWKCDCGQTILLPVSSVLSGNTKSCNRCNNIELNDQKFGSLSPMKRQTIKPNSSKKIFWLCDCGKETLKRISHVTSGKITTCGSCRDDIYSWYLKNLETIRNLLYPIYPHQIPQGGLIVKDIILKSSQKIHTTCPACKNDDWRPTWSHIKSGYSLTCGCVSNKISKINREIGSYVESIGFNVEYEFNINGLKYDIGVQNTNIVIEYHGKRWHSMPGSVNRDFKKYENATQHDYKIIVITEDDWKNSKEQIKKLILQSLSTFAL